MRQTQEAREHFEVLVVSPIDAHRRTDALANLRTLLVQNEPMYPNIGAWFEKKVVPGLATGERTAFLGYQDGAPFATGIVKHGESAKFCHLRLPEDAQGKHLGEFFFCIMALWVAQRSRRIHFTLPENLWSQKNPFFRSFGFSLRGACSRAYRSTQSELVCSADTAIVVTCIARKLRRYPRLISSHVQKEAQSTAANEMTFSRLFSSHHNGSNSVLLPSLLLGNGVPESQTCRELANGTPF